MTTRDRINAWLAVPPAFCISKWRKQARTVMRRVVGEAWDGATDEPHIKALLVLVDQAYLFGERAMHPYTAWLTERKLLKDALGLGAPQLSPPTPDDAAACDVARDLVELGRIDEARALLEEQAPNRLNVKCPTCGEYPGTECSDFELEQRFEKQWHKATDTYPDLPGGGMQVSRHVRKPRLVPHVARVTVQSGPLFGGGK